MQYDMYYLWSSILNISHYLYYLHWLWPLLIQYTEECTRYHHNKLQYPYLVGLIFGALVVGLLRLLGQLLLHLWPAAKENVVDEGVLEQGEEDKHEAAHQVHVDGFDIGDFGERLTQMRVDGSHGEHSRNACVGRERTREEGVS